MILVDVWHWVPFVFLILFAAVEGLPVDVLEAARIDGATRWQLIRRVQIPLLKPALTVALLFRSILAFKVFDEVYLLTSGGPGTATELVNLHLYKVFFEQNQLGYGALLSLAVIAAIVAFLLVARGAACAWCRMSANDRARRRDRSERCARCRGAARRVTSHGGSPALVALALFAVLGPFVWIATASFK